MKSLEHHEGSETERQTCQQMVTGPRTAINILSQWLFQVANIGITFFLIGYVIRKVGTEHYGGWASIASIIGYAGLLDAGMCVALQHYIARFATKGEKEEMAAIFSAAHLVYGAGAVVATIICLGLSETYGSMFPKIPPTAQAECAVALRWVAAGMAVFFLNMPIQGALMGLQRHDARNMSELAGLVVSAAVTLLLFSTAGPSLAHLGAAFFASVSTRFALSWVMLRRIAPAIRIRVRLISRHAVCQLYSFGVHSVVWTVCATLVRESAPILATVTLNAAAATYLYVAIRLVRALGSFVLNAGSVFVPVASSLSSSGETNRLRSALLRGTRFSALLGFSAAAGLVLFGRPVLQQWIGEDSGSIYPAVVITAIGSLPFWMFSMAEGMLMGLRAIWLLTSLQLVRLIIGLVAALVLGRYWGVPGMAAGFAASVFFGSLLWLPPAVCRRTGITVRHLLAKSLPGPLLVAGLVGTTGWMLQRIWPPTGWRILAAECVVVFVMFVSLALTAGLDASSRRMVLARAGLARG